MKYRVTIYRGYTLATFTFTTITDASNFAQMVADHIDADDDGRKFSVSIELIPEDKDEQL